MKPIKLWYMIVGFILLVPLLSCGGIAPDKTKTQLSQYSGNDESGIGGTGILADKSGIGGTGIIGEITGFGSIFVNGVEIETDSQTRLYIDGKKVAEHQFARGEVVALRADKTGKLYLAREIYIRHEVIGQVEKVLPRKKQFIVLGQRIAADALSSLPEMGTFVRISGFRDQESIIHARYISVSNNRKQNMLLGRIRWQNNKGYIGQQQVKLPAMSRVQAGETVRIHGVLDKQRVLQVKNIQRLNRLSFSKPVKNILIQGFIQKSGVQQYTISGYRFNVTELTKELLHKVDRIVLLQRANSRQVWQLSRILNQQQLPKGSALPVIPYNRSQPPLWPMTPLVPKVPRSVPYRFFR